MKKFRNTQGYLTALGGIIVITLNSGVQKSTGLFFLEVIELCDVDRSVGSIMISAFFVTSMLTSPLAVLIARRTGERLAIGGGGLLTSASLLAVSFLRQIEPIIFFFGVLQGFGYACVLIPTLLLITKHFKKSMGKALAFTGMGSLIGSLIIPMIIALTSERYATPGMFIIMSGVSLHLVLAAAIMAPAPKENSKEPQKEEQEKPFVPSQIQEEGSDVNDDQTNQVCQIGGQMKVLGASTTSLEVVVVKESIEKSPGKSTLEYLQSLSFYEINISIALSSFSIAYSFFIIPPLAEDMGINRKGQALILLVAGSSDIMARIISGVLCDRYVRYRLHLYTIIVLTYIINWIMVCCIQTYASIIVFNLIATGIAGGIRTIALPLIAYTLGFDIVDVSLGFVQALTSVLFIILSSMTSLIREKTGSWQWGLYCGLLVSLLSILISARQIYRYLCAGRREHLRKQ